MKAKVLQMVTAKSPAEQFHRTVETVESNVNLEIRSIANEDGTSPLCVIDLPNPGPHGGLCRALLTSENVDQLIVALTIWKVLR
jgi:hypothetical protein